MKQNTKPMLMATVMLAVISMLTTLAGAQNNQQPQGAQGRQGQQGGPGGQGGFGGQNGPPDATQIRQLITNQYKDALAVSDEEWAVIGPKVDRIQTLQTDLGGGMTGAMSLMMRNFSRMNRGGGPGGQGGQGGGQRFGGGGGRGPDLSAILGPETPLRRKLQALSDALDNPDSRAADIKQLLASIREDRDRGRAELAKARLELIDLLTPRQEGILFQMGILE